MLAPRGEAGRLSPAVMELDNPVKEQREEKQIFFTFYLPLGTKLE